MSVSSQPDWLPVFYPPERDDLDFSEGERLITLAETVYKTPEGGLITLDDWQKWVVMRVLAKVGGPDGPFRYRQSVVSMGRQ